MRSRNVGPGLQGNGRGGSKGILTLILFFNLRPSASSADNLPVTGTLAVLLKAKERSIIPRVRDTVDRLIAANFRVSDPLVEEVLRRVGE
jgi:predicted nucleic acid-binding protein